MKAYVSSWNRLRSTLVPRTLSRTLKFWKGTWEPGYVLDILRLRYSRSANFHGNGCSSIFEQKNSHRGSHFVLDRFSKNEKSCEGNISFLPCTAKPLNRCTASSDRSVCIKQSFYHAAPVKVAKAVPSEALEAYF